MDANEQTKSETDNHAKDRAELDTEIQRLGLDEETAGPTTVAYEFLAGGRVRIWDDWDSKVYASLDEAVAALPDWVGDGPDPPLPSYPAYRVLLDGGSGGEATTVTTDLDAACGWAEKWARGGEWDPYRPTWVRVRVEAVDDPEECEDFEVRIDPPTPECADGTRTHDWAEISEESLHGGVHSASRCRLCGLGRDRYSLYQRPDCGAIAEDVVMYEAGEDE